jgi:hypothetical protein
MERSGIGTKITGGFEYIGTMKMGESMLAIYFWSKHQFDAVPWRIAFYKARDEWNFSGCNFGPEVTSEIMILSQKDYIVVPEKAISIYEKKSCICFGGVYNARNEWNLPNNLAK